MNTRTSIQPRQVQAGLHTKALMLRTRPEGLMGIHITAAFSIFAHPESSRSSSHTPRTIAATKQQVWSFSCLGTTFDPNFNVSRVKVGSSHLVRYSVRTSADSAKSLVDSAVSAVRLQHAEAKISSSQ